MENRKATDLIKATLLLVLMALVPMTASAKNKRQVSFYLDKGGRVFAMDLVTCSVEKQGNSYFIVTSIDLHEIIDDHPVLQIRTHSGDVMKISGQTVSRASKENDRRNNYAKFRVTPQQFEKIKSGIKRFRISPTANGAVDKEFGRDKIGKKLYKLYLRAEDF